MQDSSRYQVKETVMLCFLLHDQAGQTLMEYALILMLIMLAVVAALTLIGPIIGGMLASAAAAF